MANKNDIFGYATPKVGNIYNTQMAKMTIASGGSAGEALEGTLVQAWQVNFQQQMDKVFELGSSNIYWVRGRPEGSGSIGRIAGGSGDIKFFTDQAYNACNGGDIFTISFSPEDCGGESLSSTASLHMSGCVVTGVGFSASVEGVSITQNITWQFATLQIK